jgi:HNH endonuclease
MIRAVKLGSDLTEVFCHVSIGPMSTQLRSLDENWWVLRVARRRAAERQKWKCYWCGLHMCRKHNCPMQVTLDHVVPVVLGGPGKPGNLVAACRKCNSERHPEFNEIRRHDVEVGGLIASTGEVQSESPFAVLKNMRLRHGETSETGTTQAMRTVTAKEER